MSINTTPLKQDNLQRVPNNQTNTTAIQAMSAYQTLRGVAVLDMVVDDASGHLLDAQSRRLRFLLAASKIADLLASPPCSQITPEQSEDEEEDLRSERAGRSGPRNLGRLVRSVRRLFCFLS